MTSQLFKVFGKDKVSGHSQLKASVQRAIRGAPPPPLRAAAAACLLARGCARWHRPSALSHERLAAPASAADSRLLLLHRLWLAVPVAACPDSSPAAPRLLPGSTCHLPQDPVAPHPTPPAPAARPHRFAGKIAEDYPYLADTGLLDVILPKKQDLVLIKL